MERWMLIGFSLLLSAGLSGCASGLAGKQKMLEGAAPVKKVSELQRQKLEFGKKHPYEITGKSQAFEFETGKSYTALFELPAFRDASTVEIKSYCDCVGLAKNVFIPIGVLLDESFNRVGDIEFSTHAQTMWEPVHFVATVPLKATDKYLLVYSDPKKYGQPADRVYADVTRVSKERMDYIRKGTVKETYTSAQVGVWWEGDAVGEIQVLVGNPSEEKP